MNEVGRWWWWLSKCSFLFSKLPPSLSVSLSSLTSSPPSVGSRTVSGSGLWWEAVIKCHHNQDTSCQDWRNYPSSASVRGGLIIRLQNQIRILVEVCAQMNPSPKSRLLPRRIKWSHPLSTGHDQTVCLLLECFNNTLTWKIELQKQAKQVQMTQILSIIGVREGFSWV